MPITVPRASITQSADDLKARDMVLCRFPEVDMVVGKAGRAETSTDPAPLDMIETMVNFRPHELWPKRKLRRRDAQRQAAAVLAALVEEGIVEPPANAATGAELVDEVVAESLPRFDGNMREFAFQRNAEFDRDLPLQLTEFTVRRTVRLLRRHGVLDREPNTVELALVARAVSTHADHHLAMSPLLEDVERLARHAGHELARLGFIAGSDPFVYQPGWLEKCGGFVDELLGRSPATSFARLHVDLVAEHRALWRKHMRKLNAELADRGPGTFTRVAIEELIARTAVRDPRTAEYLAGIRRLRAQPPQTRHLDHGHAHAHSRAAPVLTVAVQPRLKALQERLSGEFRGRVILVPSETEELAGFEGELDRALQMPGWTNVWTMPIQNRVDMLATGVNTAVGVRVLGRDLDDVVRASEEIAAVVKQVPGAADVVADPIRGKGYLEIRVDRERCSLAGVSVGDVNDVIETALGGRLATSTVEGRERHPVRVRYARNWRGDEESVKELPVPARGIADFGSRTADSTSSPDGDSKVQSAIRNPQSAIHLVRLADVASIRITEGPATIKSENGLLRNYVRLNVRGRGTLEFVDAARRAVTEQVALPEGVYLEWTGQFEHDARAGRTLFVVFPLVLVLIFLILYWTYHDLADALLMVLAVPGALAGGVFFQWLLGYNFSVTVLVGYIACFGMATATGIIMLVYLREAVAKAGGLGPMTTSRLRQAVLDGAVHRLRPKLLTEATTILGLAPMLWATGTGSEVIRPMAAPVLGGILVADEVIDLLLPVLFYWVRKWRLTSHHSHNS